MKKSTKDILSIIFNLVFIVVIALLLLSLFDIVSLMIFVGLGVNYIDVFLHVIIIWILFNIWLNSVKTIEENYKIEE